MSELIHTRTHARIVCVCLCRSARTWQRTQPTSRMSHRCHRRCCLTNWRRSSRNLATPPRSVFAWLCLWLCLCVYVAVAVSVCLCGCGCVSAVYPIALFRVTRVLFPLLPLQATTTQGAASYAARSQENKSLEDFLARHEFVGTSTEEIEKKQVFFRSGVSKDKRPVFYLIARRYKAAEVSERNSNFNQLKSLMIAEQFSLSDTHTHTHTYTMRTCGG